MASKNKNILKDIETFVFNLLSTKLDSSLHYHNFEHTEQTVSTCKEIIKNYDLEEDVAQQIMIAAYFHDTGFIETYDGHEEASQKIAKDYLIENTDYDAAFVDGVLDLIYSTKYDVNPEGLAQEILHDADYIHIGRKRFFRRAELLRLEWEESQNTTYNQKDWDKKQLDFLTGLKFRTRYVLDNYTSRKSKNLLEQRERYNKSRQKGRKLGRGIDTMYRNVYRTNIDLSSIADSKANMMISINTIIMSVFAAALGSGFTFSGQDFIEHIRFTIPMALLILGCLVSVIFAILSATPNVTNKDVDKKKIKERKSSVLFFGNYTELKMEEFVSSLQLLRKEQNMVYDNMTIDLYYLGKVLRKKYRLLNIAYMTFLTSLCVSMVSFLIILVISAN